MGEDDKRKGIPGHKTPDASKTNQDDGYEDEEKLLAGHHDVNMPALLTRDVKGG
ncbi:MAG TPA: hypothetical protein VHB27_02390 [Rhodopila sp.]|uniref:hypothetical protein n=1 Tax=Rhodopila sp. TaxID=2480087 RepID=UPI002C8AB744|nr:hypothetical protein [Rhodopila sp.]HVY14049.1 hypothetical protein [Rhodopila sp.]